MNILMFVSTEIIDQYISYILEFLITEPVLSIALFILILSLILFVHNLAKWIYIHYLRKKSTEFKKRLSERDTVSVLMHSNPDPDAMASALAVERLAKEVGTDVTIEYPGWIRHHENRAFRAVLDISFDRIESYEDIQHPENVILVDHQEARGFIDDDKVEPFAVIDHHDSSYTGQAEFVHIEPMIGSCSTLLTEYLSEQGISFKNDENNPDLSEHLATGLYYGIKTDTSDFSRGVNPRDYAAAQKLYNRVDTDELFKIANPKIDAETFEIKSAAFHAREVEGSFAISHVGDVSNSDTIPLAAEELSRLEGISAVVVMGFDDDLLRLSGRTYDSRVHMGSVLEKAFSEMGDASAGGHSRMGGGQIPKEKMSDEGFTIDKIKSNIFDALQGNY